MEEVSNEDLARVSQALYNDLMDAFVNDPAELVATPAFPFSRESPAWEVFSDHVCGNKERIEIIIQLLTQASLGEDILASIAKDHADFHRDALLAQEQEDV